MVSLGAMKMLVSMRYDVIALLKVDQFGFLVELRGWKTG